MRDIVIDAERNGTFSTLSYIDDLARNIFYGAFSSLCNQIITKRRKVVMDASSWFLVAVLQLSFYFDNFFFGFVLCPVFVVVVVLILPISI